MGNQKISNKNEVGEFVKDWMVMQADSIALVITDLIVSFRIIQIEVKIGVVKIERDPFNYIINVTISDNKRSEFPSLVVGTIHVPFANEETCKKVAEEISIIIDKTIRQNLNNLALGMDSENKPKSKLN